MRDRFETPQKSSSMESWSLWRAVAPVIQRRSGNFWVRRAKERESPLASMGPISMVVSLSQESAGA